MFISVNRFILAIVIASLLLVASGAARVHAASPPLFNLSHGLVLRGTVVTVDNRHSVIEDGSVLVRGDRIVAVWQGERPPTGTRVDGAVVIELDGPALIFPGMINLHNHPTYDMLRLWPTPSSDVQLMLGRRRFSTLPTSNGGSMSPGPA
jgi:hypothetical protein